ncbi:unannotated protein [freshwater metagenome]|uniref:Unannotated protein n=1 Tax=freshwater metagenome TaxID=449393 RepID=A0A6J7ET21_9ZZZZ
MLVHNSATHPAVPPSADAPAMPGSGHGSALRSTLPEVRVGISSTSASRGTSADGNCSANKARAASRSKSGLVLARYPTRTELPAAVLRTAAAAPPTPGSACSALSISPSSMRRPPSLTWSSARPWNSSPSSSSFTRSPLRYARSHPREGMGAYFSASLAGSRYRARPTPPMTSSPTSPTATGVPEASTTARSQPSSGNPMRTGPLPSMMDAHATTVASVGP